MDGGEPDIPIYKVIECTGPTNTRVYKVAVYFRGKRLASSTGHSIQQAEMEAAKKALENSSELFPQLDYQKRVMAHSMKRQKGKHFDGDRNRGNSTDLQRKLRKEDDSNLPKQYRVREKRKPSNDTESDASNLDAESSDSSHSICSAGSSNKKLYKNIKHIHEIEHIDKQKCLNMEEQVIKAEPQNQTDRNIDDQDSTMNDIKDIDDSDTDVSLESGEIL